MTSGGGSDRIVFAHLLRGLAALSVVVSHFGVMIWSKPAIVAGLIALPGTVEIVAAKRTTALVPEVGIPGLWGHFGVALFFLISGFVIPFSIRASSRAGFTVTRLLRVWPTYAAGLTITLACIAYNAASSGIPFPHDLAAILKHYLIAPRWPTLTRPIDGIIWTLEVEIFFYALCLIFAGSLRELNPRLFAGMALASVPVAWAAGAYGLAVASRSPAAFAAVHWLSSMLMLISFLLCGTAFHFHYCRAVSVRGLMACLGVLSAAFVASLRLGLHAGDGWAPIAGYGLALAVFAVCYALRDGSWRLPTAVEKPISWLADISYPLYVCHGVLGYSLIVYATARGLAPAGAVAMASVVIFGLATVLHRAVERPTHLLGRSLGKELARNMSTLGAPARRSPGR